MKYLGLENVRAVAEHVGHAYDINGDEILRLHNVIVQPGDDVVKTDDHFEVYRNGELVVPSNEFDHLIPRYRETVMTENAPHTPETATPAQKRKWLAANGYQVATRGKLSKEAEDAYVAGHVAEQPQR